MSKHDSIDISVDIKAVTEGLERKQRNMGKAINATVSDFGRRGHGWVSQEVRKVYGVDATRIKDDYKGPKKKGTVKVGGVKIDNVQLKYKGRLLTITHFKMTPKTRPSKPYQVKAAVIKGVKKVVGKSVFLAPTKKKNEDGTIEDGKIIAWRRTGAERLMIMPIKAISSEQMITSERTQPGIQKRISGELKKRWDHNVDRFDK